MKDGRYLVVIRDRKTRKRVAKHNTNAILLSVANETDGIATVFGLTDCSKEEFAVVVTGLDWLRKKLESENPKLWNDIMRNINRRMSDDVRAKIASLEVKDDES